jgi:hypothetical protein
LTDPQLLIDFIKIRYHSDGANTKKTWQIHDILRSIAIDEIQLQEPQLLAWVKDVQALAIEHDCIDSANYTIGEFCGRTKRDDGAEWPALPVRNLLEEIHSERLEAGFHTGVYNKRGATWRDFSDGGTDERELANGYKLLASQYATEWPRTSALMSELANTYQQEAKRQDEDMRQRQNR